MNGSGLLDTSVLVALEQERPLGAIPQQCTLSVVTLEELWLGVLMADDHDRETRRRTAQRASRMFDVHPINVPVARACAEIRADGRQRGRRYGPLDSMIGATARVLGVPLYTQDEGFADMPGVRVVQV